ncbi:glycine--tRNA ligase subunit beta, partial [Vibrio parahaemolyticus]|nr:glycine--tRNA ligase subunit beta [Vibrio parahaemolyticus]
SDAFAPHFDAELTGSELDHEGLKWVAAPRLIALKVAALAESQSEKVVEKRGHADSAALDAEGTPTTAAQGWARGGGISVD